MPDTGLPLLRLLTQLNPRLKPLPEAPWELFAHWCIGQGLGPLVGHNLAYILPQLPVPREAKEALLSVFQGTVAENTQHLFSLRRAMQPLEGRKLWLFGSLSMAEALYPHVGFRPLEALHIGAAQEDIEGFAGYVRSLGYAEEVGMAHAACGLSDGHSTFGIFRCLPGMPLAPWAALEAEPMPVFGPSLFSLGVEENLLALCARQYTEAYKGPWIDWIDMREAALSSRVEAQSLKAKAARWGIGHALFASLAVLGHLFECVEVKALQPAVSAEWGALATRWAKAYAGLLGALLEGRQAQAQQEERAVFEEMAAKAPTEFSAKEGE